MWEIKGKSIDAKRFEPFEPVRVLNFYDGPRIFTVLDSDGGLCLACWSDEDERRSRFLVVPVTSKTIAELERGMLTVREALIQPRMWVVDLTLAGAVEFVWLVNSEDVPDDAQPQLDTMLHRSFESDASRRNSNTAIRQGEVTGIAVSPIDQFV